jgi:hypothetical protein
MILALDCDEGILKIGSPPEILPGIVESIKASNSLLIENSEIQGRSGKVKIVQGWDDVSLLITLSLIDDPYYMFDNVQRGSGKTRWDFLKQIAGTFKKVSNNGKPEIYTLSHPMTNAWRTTRLLFSSLETTESRTRRKIDVSLEFVEYDSVAGVIQDRKGSAVKTKQENVVAAQDRMLVSDQQRRGLGRLEDRYAKL